MKKCKTCGAVYKDNTKFCSVDGTPLIDSRDTSDIYVGQMLGERYEIRQEIDSQGMWTVFKGYESATGRWVAVKTTSLGKETEKNEAEKNVKNWKHLQHPGLVKIIDSGILGDRFFLITEYIEGETLKKVIADVGSVSISLGLSIVAQILNTLEFVHHNGVLHLDLRPSKIFVTKSEDDPNFVKIDGASRWPMTTFKYDLANQESNLVPFQHGTNYTAPELFLGHKPDVRSDIYSVGIILFEMLTGCFPFPGGSLLFYKTHSSRNEMHPLHNIKPALRVSPKLEKTVLKAIQWDAHKRFPHASAFRKALASSSKKISWTWILAMAAGLSFLICLGVDSFYRRLPFIPGPSKMSVQDEKMAIRQKEEPFLDEFVRQAQIVKSKCVASKEVSEMCYVQGGNTVVGNLDGEADERPVRVIKTEPFYIDRTEVTNLSYQLFVNATGVRPPFDWEDSRYPKEKSLCPVVNVNFYSASLYAIWRAKRLPSETEWERAAHGPGENGKNIKWPWGDLFLKGFGNVQGECVVPVGRFPQGKSPYGALDMAGNVWEWTDSWYDEVQQDKVIRGGSFRSLPRQATTTYRDGFMPRYGRNDIGFRCVKDVE